MTMKIDGMRGGAGAGSGEGAGRPGPKATLPEKDVLERMVRAGLTHKQIANQFGVTRQAVGKRIGADPTDGQLYGQFSQHMPWPAVTAVHQRTYIYRSLQDLIRRQLGMPMPEGNARSLDTFLGELDARGVVVGYDHTSGWKLVPRANRPGLPDDTYMT